MSDITVPSWRPRPEPEGSSWRMFAVAGGVLAVLAIGGAIAWGLARSGPRGVPVIEADARPIKIRPENPGGLQVPNQDQLVLEPPAVRRAAERQAGATARLDQGPETPALDLLRQQAAPPTPPARPAEARPAAPSPGVAAAPRPTTNATTGPTTGPTTGQASVQLGALLSEEAARTEWDRLARRVPELAPLQPRITRLERDGQPALFRLRATGLADADAARLLCEAVRAKGGQCVPVRG